MKTMIAEIEALERKLAWKPEGGSGMEPVSKEVIEKVIASWRNIHKEVKTLSALYDDYDLNEAQPKNNHDAFTLSLDEWFHRIGDYIEEWKKIKPKDTC